MSEYALLQFYYSPPNGPVQLANNKGSSSIESRAASEPPDAHQLPGCISQDTQLGFKLMQFAVSYLTQTRTDGVSQDTSTHPPPHTLMYNIHNMTQRALISSSVGNEVSNIGACTHVINYVREFVSAADQPELGLARAVSCEDDKAGGGPLHRKIQRTGVDRILIQNISASAFERYDGDIQAIAGDNILTPLPCKSSEYNAQSIIFNLEKRMIEVDCPWAILLGGTKYLIFYLQRIDDRASCYRHLLISKSYPVFTIPPMPSLLSVLIALLLSDDAGMAYTPPRTIAVSTDVPTLADIERDRTLSQYLLRLSKKTGKRKRMATDTGSSTPTLVSVPDVLDRINYCTLSFPDSSDPSHEINFTRATSSTAFDGALIPILKARRTLDSPTKKGTVGEEEESRHCHLFALKALDPAQERNVHGALLAVGGHEELPCAAKFLFSDEYNTFVDFQTEVTIYERLQGRSYIPEFYCAFAGMDFMGPNGVLVAERAERTFNSFEEMSLDEKNAAIKCIEQLHLAGLYYYSVYPWKFGTRNNGEMVIMGFSEVECKGTFRTCKADDPDGCRHFQHAKNTILNPPAWLTND